MLRPLNIRFPGRRLDKWGYWCTRHDDTTTRWKKSASKTKVKIAIRSADNFQKEIDTKTYNNMLIRRANAYNDNIAQSRSFYFYVL